MRYARQAVLVLAALVQMSVQAQQTPAPRRPSEPERPRRDLSDVPIQPTLPPEQPSAIPSVPGTGPLKYALPGRRFLPEGTFISGVVGTLIRTANNDLIFVPSDKARDDQDPASQPFVLQPSQKLAQLDAATRSLDPSVKVVLTGQVYVYRDRQYLLINAYSVKPLVLTPEVVAPGKSDSNKSESGNTESGSSDSQSGSATSERTENTTDPSVADLIRELENERGPERLLDPATPSGATPPEADESKQALLTPEGTLISNRRGRIVRQRGLGGRLSFAFDNDADNPATQPMIIMPCGLLLAMEQLAASRGDELTFTVSGRVLAYEGRNYLLPILYRVRQPTDVKPLQ